MNKFDCNHEKTFIQLPVLFDYQTQEDQDQGIKNESIDYCPIRLDTIYGFHNSSENGTSTLKTQSGSVTVNLTKDFLVKKLHEYGFNFSEEIKDNINSVDDLLNNL